MTKPLAYALALTIPLLAACSTTQPTPAPSSRWQSRAGDLASRSELTLPIGWWHDPQLAEPLALTSEQFQRLDAVQPKQEEAAKLERDSMVAFRELRTRLETGDATAADIVASGANLRSLRAALLERQIEVIAEQREILTLEQWNGLQRRIAEQDRPRRQEGQRQGGRGRGGRGGGGRRPGW